MAKASENKTAKKPKGNELTPKQELFCKHYIEIGIATEAYKLAYNTTNQKQSTIWGNSCRLLHNSKVIARIAELQAERDKATAVDRARTEKVLMGIVDFDPADMYTVDESTGKLRMKNPRQLPKALRQSITVITNAKGVVSYRFASKIEAARQLAKNNGWESPKEVNSHLFVEDGGDVVMRFSGAPSDDDDE